MVSNAVNLRCHVRSSYRICCIFTFYEALLSPFLSFRISRRSPITSFKLKITHVDMAKCQKARTLAQYKQSVGPEFDHI